MNKPIAALQLYTVRDFAEKDLQGTLAEVKAMGYDAVELAGMYGKSAPALKAALDEAGLSAVSAHVQIHAFKEDPAGTVEAYKTVGCKYIGIPWMETAALPGGENWEKSKALLEEINGLCEKADIKLMYHCHAHEFAKLPNGQYILDQLFIEIPQLDNEIDSGWVDSVGIDPAIYIRKYAGKVPVIHLKDTDRNVKQDRPVGQGTQNMREITKAAEESGTQVLVAELDEAVGMTSLEAARQSREYLKSLGY